MTGTTGYGDLRTATVRRVAQLMAAAAITAPKSGGQLFLASKPNFMKTVITDDTETPGRLAAWMRARPDLGDLGVTPAHRRASSSCK